MYFSCVKFNGFFGNLCYDYGSKECITTERWYGWSSRIPERFSRPNNFPSKTRNLTYLRYCMYTNTAQCIIPVIMVRNISRKL
jgi:hypothetical protein